jgi:hypothetical protein
LNAALQTFKELEGDASQLNRLGVVYFLIVYFRFRPRSYFGFAFLVRFSKLNRFSEAASCRNFKSVGAQWSACFISFAQILAMEKKLLSSSSGSS